MEKIKPEAVGFSAERLARIRPALQRYVDAGKIAGMVSLVARQGKIVHFDCVGRLDIKAHKPMDADAIFRIYSMTKPITSTAVMMLLEEGFLRINDPISSYIPELKELKVIARKTQEGVELEDARRPITIRDLLTHTAGFSYGFDQNDYLDRLYIQRLWRKFESQKNITLKDFVQELAGLPLAHQPGTVFHYSVAIDVLGYLVEIISGMRFDDFLRQRIFEPLNMVDTGFWVPPEKAHRLAVMYGPVEKKPGKLKDIDPAGKSQYLQETSFFSGGGGLVSTTMDYLRFCQMLLNGGELDGVRLLGRKTVETMRLNHLPAGVFEDANRAHGFGLGGYVTLYPERWHSMVSEGTWGWGGAANTKFWIDFKEQLIGILMLQFQPNDLYPVEQDYQNLVYQALVD